MTKKEFIALADAVRDEGFTDYQLDILCYFMRRQNERFDGEKWLGYVKGECGSGGKTAMVKPQW